MLGQANLKLRYRIARAAIAAFAVLALGGCGDALDKRFPPAPDFCAQENRQIPDLEKKVIALTRWYQTGATRVQYLDDYLRGVLPTNASKGQIASSIEQYLNDNPLCCQLVRPDHLGNQIWHGDAWMADQYVYAREWGYFADLVIFRRPPFYDLKGRFGAKDVLSEQPNRTPTKADAVMINTCGDTRGYDRG